MKLKFTFLLFLSIYTTAFAQWKPTSGLFSGEVHSVIVSNNELIVGAKQIYKSSNNGRTWFVSNNGITAAVTAIRGIVKISTTLVSITNAGVFYSADNGNNWTQAAGTSGLNIWGIIVKGTNVFISTDANGLYKSTDNGHTWATANTGLNISVAYRCFAIRGTDLYAGSDGYGIYKSTTDGASWTNVNTGLPGSYYAIAAMAAEGNTLFAGTTGAGMYVSTNGTSWSAINNGISSSEDVMGIGVNGTSVYASTFTGTLLKTTDYVNWNAVSIGTYTVTRFETFFKNGSDFYVGSWGGAATGEKCYGVFKTSDDGTTWRQVGITDYPVSCIEPSGSNILAGTYDVSGNSSRASIFKTTEADTTWNFSLGGLSTGNVTALKSSGAVAYLFDEELPGSCLVYRSTNNGNNWTSTGYNVLYNNFTSFVIAGSIVYACDNSPYYSSDHVFVSSDNGVTFSVVNSGIPSSVTAANGLALKGTTLFLATDNGIYKNTVGANAWTAVNTGLTNMIIKSIYVSGSILYAGTQGGGIFKSTNDGALWTSVSTGLPLFANITCFTSASGNVFAGTDNGVFATANAGATWSNINTGLIDTSITVLNASANYLWAGTTTQGIWRRNISQVVTGIAQYELMQQSVTISPNPASNKIKIEFAETSVENTISIYNALGSLMFKSQSTDTELTIDVSSFAKGVYFVQIIDENKTSITKKLVVN